MFRVRMLSVNVVAGIGGVEIKLPDQDIIRDTILENTNLTFIEAGRIAELIREKIEYEANVFEERTQRRTPMLKFLKPLSEQNPPPEPPRDPGGGSTVGGPGRTAPGGNGDEDDEGEDAGTSGNDKK